MTGKMHSGRSARTAALGGPTSVSVGWELSQKIDLRDQIPRSLWRIKYLNLK